MEAYALASKAPAFRYLWYTVREVASLPVWRCVGSRMNLARRVRVY